jgi:hypothetical protein
MIHAEKTMFHAADGFSEKFLIDWNQGIFPAKPTENRGFKIKKLLVLMMALTLFLSLAAILKIKIKTANELVVL